MNYCQEPKHIRNSSCCIYETHGIIVAISKHVVADKTLAGGGIGICVEETADGGVVISALQVIEAGFGVVDIAAVAEGIQYANGGG